MGAYVRKFKGGEMFSHARVYIPLPLPFYIKRRKERKDNILFWLVYFKGEPTLSSSLLPPKASLWR